MVSWLNDVEPKNVENMELKKKRRNRQRKWLRQLQAKTIDLKDYRLKALKDSL
jgi:hypothetical protein